VFGLIYVMTQGGPGHATSVYIYYLYETAFSYGKIGYASAMAWILFAVIATVTFVQWRLQKRWVFYE
jgi:multiple sugar transport system permease protein